MFLSEKENKHPRYNDIKKHSCKFNCNGTIYCYPTTCD